MISFSLVFIFWGLIVTFIIDDFLIFVVGIYEIVVVR